MRTGLIVLSRYNSSRLPGKALRDVAGAPLLGRIVERLRVTSADEVIVATSEEGHDDLIADFCRSKGVACFRGSLDDVAGRFLNCAQEFGLDVAGRINGDNLFVDLPTVEEALGYAREQQYDFITNVPGRTYPFGMSVELVGTEFFEQAISAVDCERMREHVTLYLYENPDLGRRKHLTCPWPDAAGLQLAIDEPEDLERAREIFARLEGDHREYGLRELLGLL